MASSDTISGRVVKDYVLGHQIGSGSFAVVFKGRNKVTGEEVAIKEINVDRLNRKLRQSLESEVSILRRIRHDNIVALQAAVEEGNKMYLVMEYCSGGDLAGYIRRCRRVPEDAARTLMQQLAAGLRELWSHHLVHRDLKPQNLLLSHAGPGATLKIADFGFARNLQPQGLAETLCGSPLYMAPEILQFHKYDSKADLWSVGTILYELLVGKPPFNGANHVQLLRNIERSEARVPAGIAAGLSPHCTALLAALLKRNPVERISFEEFFAHPFLCPDLVRGTAGGGSGDGVAEGGHVGPAGGMAEAATRSDALPPAHRTAGWPIDAPCGGDEGRHDGGAFAVPPCGPQQRRTSAGGGGGFKFVVDADHAGGKPLLQFAARPQALPARQCTYAEMPLKPEPAPAALGQLEGPPAPGAGSMDSIEEDYVLVDSLHSTAGGGSGAAATRRPGVDPAPGSAGQQPQHVDSGGAAVPPPALLAPPPLCCFDDGGDGLPALPGGRCAFPLQPSEQEVLWEVARILDYLAYTKEQTGLPQEALPLQLLALELLAALLASVPAESWAAMAGLPDGEEGPAAGVSLVVQAAHKVAATAETSAERLAAEGWRGPLPDAAATVYGAALALGRGGAVEELLGNHGTAVAAYARGGMLLYFLCTDLTLLAPSARLHLADADREAVHAAVLHTSARYMASKAAEERSATGQEAAEHGESAQAVGEGSCGGAGGGPLAA